MDADELRDAMTIGEHWDTPRGSEDLGRFGMGLKAASFSQADRLTVASRRNPLSTWNTRTWDLSHVTDKGEWYLSPDAGATANQILSEVQGTITQGTIVLMEGLRREQVYSPPKGTARDFYSSIEPVEKHLSAVFARYVLGRGPRKIRLRVNGAEVDGWDPFLSGHPSTRELPHEEIQQATGEPPLIVRPYVLPPAHRLSEQQLTDAEGPRGWVRQQGFYVYRNHRLIHAGGWLSLPRLRMEDRYKLARIAIEMPVSHDESWQLNVNKTSVQPPASVRPTLMRIAKATRREAEGPRNVFDPRKRAEEQGVDYIWTIHDEAGTYCRINRQHPIVHSALSGSKSEANRVEALLVLLERNLPVEAIQMLSGAAHDGRESPSSEEVLHAAEEYLAMLRRAGHSASQAYEVLRATPPFNQSRGFWSESEPMQAFEPRSIQEKLR